MSRSPRHLLVPAALSAVLAVALCTGLFAQSGSSMMLLPAKQAEQCLLKTSPRQCLASWLRRLGSVVGQLPGNQNSQAALFFGRVLTQPTNREALSLMRIEFFNLPGPLPQVQLHLLNLPPPLATI